ncbi:MAG TPA: MFS transporter [Rhizomicrobium sp.]|jgi:ACS family tartrate transporter-like MFS transporter|nr:MFS transporter [Rhizomicrobium sp.]
MIEGADAILARAAWRLIPFMALLYVASFLDRVNIGFAALTMNRDLGFSPQVYGFASGIFFFGYFLFEVPSNLALEKVGARTWMCRICVTWGALSMLTAFARSPAQFCVLRFLLGAAEAGLYPGMVLYMTYWFPQATRARFIALFLAAVPAANVIGAPLSGWLLGLSAAGLKGWQWMLILEGIPSLLFGALTLWVLPDRPASAKWLSPREKGIIAARLAAEPPGALHGFWEMLADKRIWILIIPDFSIVIALYGLNLWLPQMVKAMGYTNLQTGFIVALPYVLAMIAMVALGIASDRSGKRAGPVAFAAFAGAAGMAAAALLAGPVAIIAALCLASCGIYAALAVFWTLPTAMLRGTAAAGGLALLNSFSNLGGFFGPSLMGWLKQRTGGYTMGMELLAGMLVLAGVSVIVIGRRFFARAT